MIELRAREARPQGGGGVHSPCWDNHGHGGPAGGKLKPGVKVTTWGDRRCYSYDMRDFLFACLKYERQMCITNQQEGDRVPAWRRELVDPATQMIVANDV